MKIGIALGAGGAKAFAHIGILKVLAQAGIECDVVAGTSMGSLVGAVYASGNIQKLGEAASKIKLSDIPGLLGPMWPNQGLCDGRGFLKHLNEIIEVENIEDLQKPFAAVCVDLNKSEMFTFTKGVVCQAVQSSMAIPAIFAPVIFEDKLLVDGGVLEPIPVQAARSLGADFVIAVDLLTNCVSCFTDSDSQAVKSEVQESLLLPPVIVSILDGLNSILKKLSLKKEDGLEEKYILQQLGILNIVRRTSELTQMGLMKYRLKEYPADFVISPKLAHVGLLDLHRAKEAIEGGEQATKAVLPELLKLIKKKGS
ncbi:MAG TPA: patatin-like phospholipase family protein [Thermodesulfobacteriota bacterium]|nr:patatin-like phospholipase family protein [Thermodesulfobacteriota bacterium]